MGGIKTHLISEETLLEREVMPVFNIYLKSKGNMVRIIPLGCLHYGHEAALSKKIDRFIKYILQTPDTYTILMGDLMENVIPRTAIKHSGSMYEQIMKPSDQLKEVVKKFGALAKAGKILFSIGGNHGLRSWYDTDIHPDELIAQQLGIRFAAFDALCNIYFGEQIYTIHAIHGTGSTGDPAAVIKKIMNQPRRMSQADIYLRGHHHTKVLAEDYHFDAVTGKAKKVLYVGTGSFLGYVNTYACRGEFKPAVPGAVKIKLYKKEKDIHAIL